MKDIKLRLIEESDHIAFYNLVYPNTLRLKLYFPALTQAVSNEQAALRFVKKKVKQTVERAQFYFVIVEVASQNIIGVVNLRKLNWNVPKGELSYFVDGSFEGKGYATAAVKLVIDFAFNELRVLKLYAQIDPENVASLKVIERNGFVKEGYFKNEFRTGRGELRDIVRYGLLRP